MRMVIQRTRAAEGDFEAETKKKWMDGGGDKAPGSSLRKHRSREVLF
jgi:hypothetical protein